MLQFLKTASPPDSFTTHHPRPPHQFCHCPLFYLSFHISLQQETFATLDHFVLKSLNRGLAATIQKQFGEFVEMGLADLFHVFKTKSEITKKCPALCSALYWRSELGNLTIGDSLSQIFFNYCST